MASKLALKHRSPDSPTNNAEAPSGNKRRKITSSPQLCSPCQLLTLDRRFEYAWKSNSSARDGDTPLSRQPKRAWPGGPIYFEDSFLVHRFQSRLANPSKCLLCTFFRCKRMQPDLHQNYKLLAFCSSESALFCRPRLKSSSVWDKISHTVFMAVVPDVASILPRGYEESWLEKDIPAVGSIYRLRPGKVEDVNTLLNARELHEKVDFGIIREWLSYCNEHHN